MSEQHRLSGSPSHRRGGRRSRSGSSDTPEPTGFLPSCAGLGASAAGVALLSSAADSGRRSRRESAAYWLISRPARVSRALSESARSSTAGRAGLRRRSDNQHRVALQVHRVGRSIRGTSGRTRPIPSISRRRRQHAGGSGRTSSNEHDSHLRRRRCLADADGIGAQSRPARVGISRPQRLPHRPVWKAGPRVPCGHYLCVSSRPLPDRRVRKTLRP